MTFVHVHAVAHEVGVSERGIRRAGAEVGNHAAEGLQADAYGPELLHHAQRYEVREGVAAQRAFAVCCLERWGEEPAPCPVIQIRNGHARETRGVPCREALDDLV